jgi:UDP-N-acetylglucosamine 2-epimerase (non-hydrolysing)
MKRILIVVGARPNFMKAAPLLRELYNLKKVQITLVHTGQHYDRNMSEVFFEDLDIKKPDFMLKIGSGSHSEQTANIMIKFEKVCIKTNPNLVIVFGDINSTMACSIVAKKMNIKLAHVESGLRSNDLKMPEEINRIITDSITDYFFVTEKDAITNLLKEGKNKRKIYHVGNLMIDSLHYGLNKLIENNKNGDYGLVTLHRPSNVDNIDNLKQILSDLTTISKELKLIFSIHPRTMKKIKDNNVKIESSITLLESLSYLEFLSLMKYSKAIFTDSGGIQEETTALKIPCYTLRYNTERPITIVKGTNILVEPKRGKIIEAFNENKFEINPNYELPFGWDGKAAKRITKILEKEDY